MGQVKYPGAYSLSTTTDRLRELLLERSGGLLETAHPDGITVSRDGKHINVDFERVTRNPSGVNNMLLQPGDTIFVPEYDPIVRVEGGVAFPTSVLYRKGAGLDYYIRNAGGYSRYADKKRVSVRYANGGGETVKSYVLMKKDPEPKPGSTIFVPLIPEADRQPLRAREVIKDVAQIVGTIGAIVVVILRTN